MPPTPNAKFVDSIKPQNIPIAALRFRQNQLAPTIETTCDGGHCRIFKLVFADGETWAFRVPIFNRCATAEQLVAILTNEHLVLQKMGNLDKPWIPQLKGHDMSFENEIGYPFLILNWFEGRPLTWKEHTPARAERDMILDDLVAIQEAILKHTREEGSTSASAELTSLVDQKFTRVASGDLAGVLLTKDIAEQKALLPRVLLPELDNAGFALDHGDLQPNNIIVNDQHRIVGIIDWGCAYTRPMHIAARWPALLQLEYPKDLPSEIKQKDRARYYSAISMAQSDATRYMRAMLRPDGADFRHFLLASIVDKGMLIDMVQAKWRVAADEVDSHVM